MTIINDNDTCALQVFSSLIVTVNCCHDDISAEDANEHYANDNNNNNNNNDNYSNTINKNNNNN